MTPSAPRFRLRQHSYRKAPYRRDQTPSYPKIRAELYAIAKSDDSFQNRNTLSSLVKQAITHMTFLNTTDLVRTMHRNHMLDISGRIEFGGWNVRCT